MVGAMVVSGTFHYIGLLSLLLPLSLFSLARYGTRRQGLSGSRRGSLPSSSSASTGVPDLRTKDVLLAVSLLVAAWALAEALRSRQDQQRDRVDAAVAEERLRIARELHDVVAHSMSLIAVQAGVGAHVIRTDPRAAEQSLDVIADTSRKALEQTRSMLGMLRGDADDGTRPPTQGLADLSSLVDDVRAAGLEVDLVRTGAAADVDDGRVVRGVPHRPGVAHQRHQALGGHDGDGPRRGRGEPGSTSRSATPARDVPASTPPVRVVASSGSTSAPAWWAGSWCTASGVTASA